MELSSYFKRYLNFTQKIERVSHKDIDSDELKDILEKTPSYPNDGSVFLFEDRIYLKFSDD